MNDLSVFYEHIADAAKQSGLALEKVCGRVKDFGFDLVEIDAKRLFGEGSAILPVLESAGLGINCIYNFFNFGRTQDSLDADLEEARRVIDLCGLAKCTKILAVAGFLTEAEMDRTSAAYAARRARMAESLTQMVRAAAERGITVVMEDFDGDSAPFSTAEELLWFMENVPGLRCGFDTGNFLYSEQDAAAVLPAFLPYISAVHCKDRTFEPNAGERKETIGGRAMYPVAVGSGCIDIAGMMKAILHTGYAGAFAVEHFGSPDQLADMERSASFLRGVLASGEA